MKKFTFLLVFSSSFFSQAQTLEKLWETAPVVATPESVLPDSKKGLLYISLINGAPWEADGKGGIGRIKEDGTGYDSTWITGLHAPKGMGLYKNKLYVADINTVVVVNVKKGKIENKISIKDAVALNDITITKKGIVYVSDSRTGKVWRLEKDVPSPYMENLQGINGLKAVQNELWIASGKTFLKADQKKQTTKLAELPQGGDGVEPIGNGDFLVSAWAGYLFYVSANGSFKSIMETHADKRNIADIGYDQQKKIIYIPSFFANTVAAYRLK